MNVVVGGYAHPARHGFGLVRIAAGPQWRFREGRVQVADDVGGLDVHHAVMDQGRHQALWVDAEIFRRDVFALVQVQMVARPLNALFRQRHPHPHGAIGLAEVIQMKSLVLGDGLVRWRDDSHSFCPCGVGGGREL